MDKELLEKYYNDKCSPEEREKVWKWFQTPEGETYLKQEMDRDIRVEEEFNDYIEYPGVNSDQIFSQIQKNKPTSWKQNINGWKKAAAAVLLIGLLGIFMMTYLQVTGTEKRVVVTQPGEKKTLMMPDSSRIVLHGNSSLEYDIGFENRNVFLEGEAYFEVEHDKEHPFMVFVEETYVKVLGTKFVVSEYAETERVKVAVKSGRVEMGSSISENGGEFIDTIINDDNQDESPKVKENPIEILDNQVGVKDKNSTPFITDSIQYKEVFDWVDGKMIFNNTELPEVIAELEKRFAVQIVLQDQTLREKKFTSSFEDESLNDILKVLTLSFDASYKRDGNTIFITD